MNFYILNFLVEYREKERENNKSTKGRYEIFSGE